jgi:hypothetical protein
MKCSGQPADCELCDTIRQIFECFPKEVNPGCEIGKRRCVAREELGSVTDVELLRAIRRSGQDPMGPIPPCSGVPTDCRICDIAYGVAEGRPSAR